jgi:predicted nuclease with RNAse H fold
VTQEDQDLAESIPDVTGMTEVTVRGKKIATMALIGVNVIEIVRTDPRKVQKEAESITKRIENDSN